MYQLVGAWGPIDDYPETRAELEECPRVPAPCDGCPHAARCAVS